MNQNNNIASLLSKCPYPREYVSHRHGSKLQYLNSSEDHYMCTWFLNKLRTILLSCISGEATARERTRGEGEIDGACQGSLSSGCPHARAQGDTSSRCRAPCSGGSHGTRIPAHVRSELRMFQLLLVRRILVELLAS